MLAVELRGACVSVIQGCRSASSGVIRFRGSQSRQRLTKSLRFLSSNYGRVLVFGIRVLPLLFGVSFGSPSLLKKTFLRVDMSSTYDGGTPMYSITYCIYSSSDSPGNIGFPVSNSRIIVPNDHISMAWLYDIPNIISGARQKRL